MSYGFASNLRGALPNASFIGFTGTPIEKTNANTRAVFGDYISIYDIQRAVADKATVAIYYELTKGFNSIWSWGFTFHITGFQPASLSGLKAACGLRLAA